MKLLCKLIGHSWPNEFVASPSLFSMIGFCARCGHLVYDNYESGALSPTTLKWSQLTEDGRKFMAEKYPNYKEPA